MRDEGGGMKRAFAQDAVLKSETIVILVSSDPKPGDHVTFSNAKGAVMIANSNDVNVVAASVEPK